MIERGVSERGVIDGGVTEGGVIEGGAIFLIILLLLYAIQGDSTSCNHPYCHLEFCTFHEMTQQLSHFMKSQLLISRVWVILSIGISCGKNRPDW